MLGALVTNGLARRGHDVVVYERRPGLFDGASAAGEGKIHLGHVYALGGMSTANVMLRAALGFDRAVDGLIGRPLDWDRLRGGRFRYVVAPESLVTPDDLVAHGERLEELRREVVHEDPSSTYLGRPLDDCRLRPVDGMPRWFDLDERCVDVQALRRVLVDALDSAPTVTVHRGVGVVGVEQVTTGWRLELLDASGTPTAHEHPIVVNCSWEDSARLDRAAGIPRSEPPNLRLRTFVHGHVDAAPMAVTVVHGPFGDVVVHRDGRLYASWYPTGLLGFANAESAPPEWCSALDDPRRCAEQIEATLENLRRHVPGLGPVLDATVSARVVVARGRTDIDDLDSELHVRDESGLEANDGWISARSTKLTTAPQSAAAVVARIEQW